MNHITSRNIDKKVQLKKLKEAHLLTSKKKAQMTYYHIHPLSQKVIDHVFEIFKKELT